MLELGALVILVGPILGVQMMLGALLGLIVYFSVSIVFDHFTDKRAEWRCGPWVEELTQSANGSTVTQRVTVKGLGDLDGRIYSQPALRELWSKSRKDAYAYCETIGASGIEFVSRYFESVSNRLCSSSGVFEAKLVQEYRCVQGGSTR